VRVLFDGQIPVHYRFLFLQPSGEWADLGRTRGGQVNGLCGAALPGVLAMTTGLHTGPVPVRIEAHDLAPPLTSEWEEVVEVSVAFASTDYCLTAFEAAVEVPAPGLGSYRARWQAQGMDEARAADFRAEDEPALDRYLLQLWPAPPAGDAIVRQTSAAAAYWHGVAGATPPA
jgi:hypothetical protein